MPKTFSLDYDDTFTADPNLWCLFIQHAHMAGHTVVCITARDGTDADKHELRAALPNDVKIYFASFEPKAEYAKRVGLVIDIWIDDMPEWIVK